MDEIKVFGKTSLSDLLKEIYDNSKNKKVQVDLLVSDILSYISDAKSAVQIVPLLKELLEVGVKNDEQLVKLAVIVQKINSKVAAKGDDYMLTDEEKNQLLHGIEETAKELQTRTDDIIEKSRSKGAS